MKVSLGIIAALISLHSYSENCSTAKLVGLPTITRCAEQGDRTAQYVLGQIYFHGKEVPKNYRLSFEWTSKAANQGDKDAQSALGFDYFNGWGTEKDFVMAYMWWSLSVQNNEEPIVRQNLNTLETKLSPMELSRAQQMATDWVAKHK